MDSIFLSIKKFNFRRNVLKNLTIKNFKTKYLGSVIGVMWTIIIPLLMAIVINVIFTKILKVGVEKFALFVLSGFLPWMFFSRALSESANSIIENVNLLNQFQFPREIIPLSNLLSNFLSFIFGFLIMLPIFIIFNYRIIFYLWVLPIVLIFFLFFAAGLCLLLSALNVLTRDVKHLLEIFLLFWFWMTPVFYSIDMVPGFYRIISYLNPLTFYMIMFHDILYNAKFPDMKIFMVSLILSLASFFLGYFVFLKLSPNFLKKI